MFGASVVASLISLVIPPAYIGLLGLAPIGLGLMKLRAWNEQTDPEEGGEARSPAPDRQPSFCSGY